MTTDRIMAADTHVDASRDSDRHLADAEDQAKQIVAKARYDAFRMVTDARAEAEAILAEVSFPEATPAPDATDLAATVAESQAAFAAAEARATEIVEQAIADADEIRSSANEDIKRENALLAEENETLMGRVSDTRAVLESLEGRLAAIAAPPPPPADNARTESLHQPTPQAEPTAAPGSAPGRKGMRAKAPTATAKPQVEAPIPPVETAKDDPVALDYSPSVPPPPRQAPEEDVPEPAEGRGSFYSRRSAKLPRIGETAGQNALGAMKSVRKSIES